MQRRYDQFNPKRRLRQATPQALAQLQPLVERACYGGNPEHKRDPGDFGLTPPAAPRPAKSLCDVAQVFTRREAQRLLKEGMRRGLVSERTVNGWPQNVWAVADNGTPLEAQLENSEQGIYHGYPMPESDPLAAEVLKRWQSKG